MICCILLTACLISALVFVLLTYLLIINIITIKVIIANDFQTSFQPLLSFPDLMSNILKRKGNRPTQSHNEVMFQLIGDQTPLGSHWPISTELAR